MNGAIITGASSMLGVALIKECIKNNIKVAALIRKNSKNINRIPSSDLVKIIECDLHEMAGFDLKAILETENNFDISKNEKIAKTGSDNIYGIAKIDSDNIQVSTKMNSDNILEITETDNDNDNNNNNNNNNNNVNKDSSYDVFYHFAWRGTDKIERYSPGIQLENIRYTLDAIALAKRCGCNKFIGAGSQAEYGPKSCMLSPNTPVNPTSAYGIAKYASSKLGGIECENLGISIMWVRILSVYGPFDSEHTLIMSCIKKILANEPIKLTRCEQLWDYLYCEDAARAFVLIAEKGVDKSVYCLGSGTASPLFEYVEAIKDEINPLFEPGIGLLEYQKDQVMFLCADTNNLRKDTGFTPQFDFKTGIKNTINWFTGENSK